MKGTGQRGKGDDHQVASSDSSTLRTSQSDQARGYLESLTDNDFMGEIQSALEHAQRLTKQSWKLIITSDNVEIHCDESTKRIKLPKPTDIKKQRPS
jgi:hypothetical protein